MELILLFFASFGSVIVLFLFYLGYFNPIKFKTVDMPETFMTVVPFRGAYKDATQAQVALHQELMNAGFTISISAGIYFDDPKHTAEKDLRSLVGAVIDPKNRDKISKLGSHIRSIKLPTQKALHTTFAYKSGLSIMLAIMKVYPAITKVAKRREIELTQSVEIYDFPNKSLNYYFPKQSIENLWNM